MVEIAVVVGSTRPGRRSRQVADWVLTRANSRGGADFATLDLADYDLPLLDEPLPPSLGNYRHEHTKVWAAAVSRFDGFVFVTAEYNHSVPGALKNALDYLYGGALCSCWCGRLPGKGCPVPAAKLGFCLLQLG